MDVHPPKNVSIGIDPYPDGFSMFQQINCPFACYGNLHVTPYWLPSPTQKDRRRGWLKRLKRTVPKMVSSSKRPPMGGNDSPNKSRSNGGGAVKTMGKPRENGELTNKHWHFMGFIADLCWFMVAKLVYISLWIQTLSKKVLHPPNHTPNTS